MNLAAFAATTAAASSFQPASLAVPTPILDDSTYEGLTATEIARQAMGATARAFADSKAYPHSIASDPRRVSVGFYTKPVTIRPGLCGVGELVVAVVLDRQPEVGVANPPGRAITAQADQVFRTTGPLAATPAAAKPCDFPNPSENFAPNSPGAFVADSPETAWRATLLLQDAIKGAHVEGTKTAYDLTCLDAGPCDDPKSILSAMSPNQMLEARSGTCGPDCFEVEAQVEAGQFFYWRIQITAQPDDPARARKVTIKFVNPPLR